jgi:hypothetical protein
MSSIATPSSALQRARARAFGAAAALLLSLSAPAAAHDFWIQPATFQPESGALLPVQALVGELGVGKAVERHDDRIARFVLVGPGFERPVAGRDGALPIGLVRVAPPDWRLGAEGAPLTGLVVLGYRSHHARVEIEPDKFEEYLRLEGLEPILALRGERGASALPAREAYSRCAKALVHVGPAAATAAGDAGAGGGATSGGESAGDRVLGFTLELVAEQDPSALRDVVAAEGDVLHAAELQPLTVQLLFEGRPLAGALVRATPLVHAPRAEDPAVPFGAPTPRPLRVRTDASGRAELRLPHRGEWLLTAVHMRPAPADIDVPDVEWESFWASLTFAVPEASAAPAR